MSPEVRHAHAKRPGRVDSKYASMPEEAVEAAESTHSSPFARRTAAATSVEQFPRQPSSGSGPPILDQDGLQFQPPPRESSPPADSSCCSPLRGRGDCNSFGGEPPCEPREVEATQPLGQQQLPQGSASPPPRRAASAALVLAASLGGGTGQAATRQVPRGITWDCTSHVAEPSPVTPAQAEGGDDGVARIEASLQACEVSLLSLEERARDLLGGQSPWRRWPPPQPEEPGAVALIDSGLELSRRFEELAADSLEFGCGRVAGAMELFERANAGLERMAACLHLCRQALDLEEGRKAEAKVAVAEEAIKQNLSDEPALKAQIGGEADFRREDAASAVAKAFMIATGIALPEQGNSPCTGLH